MNDVAEWEPANVHDLLIAHVFWVDLYRKDPAQHIIS